MAEVLSQSQIDALLNAALSGDLKLDAGDGADQEKKFRKYDFNSPRKFTKDRIKMLHGIFENYTRLINSRLNTMLHTSCEITVDSVEEQRYYEFSNALSEGSVLSISHIAHKGKTEEMPILLSISTPVMLGMMDRLMGGEGDQDQSLSEEYSFTDVELQLYENVMRDLIPVMAISWENYLRVEFEFTRVETNPTLVQLIGLDETVVIVDIGLNFFNSRGQLSICLPGMMLTNLFTEISSENPGRRVSGEDKSDEIFDSLRDSNLEVVAELGHAELQLSDVFHMNVGDVINLNQPKDSMVLLKVGGYKWFEGRMGVHGKSIAIQVSKTEYVEE